MNKRKSRLGRLASTINVVEFLEGRQYLSGLPAPTATISSVMQSQVAMVINPGSNSSNKIPVTVDVAPLTSPQIPAPAADSPGVSNSPGPVLTTLTPTFSWEAITGATITGYQINLHNVTSDTTISYTTGISVSQYTVASSAALSAGDSYVWNVRGVDGSTTGSPSVYLYFETPGPAATLPAPAAVSPGSSASPGPTISTLMPTFTWDAIIDATFTGYQINLHNVTTDTSVSYTTGTSVTSYTTPSTAPLLAGDTYVWNVRALDESTSGPPSNYLYFQTPSATVTLPSPVAVAPGTGTEPGPPITALTPTFTWQGITGATFTGYQITLFNGTTDSTAEYSVGIGDTSFTLPSSAELAEGDAYIWNIRAVNGTQSGPPSNYLYFEAPSATSVVLPAPVAVAPGTSVSPGPAMTTFTPTFSWQAISGVTFTGYQINLFNANTQTTVSYVTGSSVTSFTLPATAPLIAGDSYVWNVRALNGTQSGTSSAYLYFEAPAAASTTLPAPISISPGSSVAAGPIVTTLTPTFNWQAISGATLTGYQINLFDVTSNSFVIYTTGAGDASFTLPSTGTLVAGNAYEWNVRAVNGAESGPPSVYLYFQTPMATTPVSLPAPGSIAPGVNSSPGPLVTSLTPTFTWQAITGVTFTGYQINIYNETTQAFVSYTTGTNVTSFTVAASTPLAAGDSYVWNVRALSGTQSGPPSVYLYFQTMPVTSLPIPVSSSPGTSASPGPALTTLNPMFSWEAATGVSITGYQIYIHDISTDTTISYQVDASETSFMPLAPLTPSDAFVWNVRTLDGGKSGPPSVYLYFQTPAPMLPPIPVVGDLISNLQPGPVQSTLPTAIAADAAYHGNTIVKVANNTISKFKGLVNTQLYATLNGVIDSSSVLIGSLMKTLTIRAGRTVNVVVKVSALPASLEGTYSILARTTDATGATADSTYGPTLQIAPSFAAFSATVATLPAPALKTGAAVVLSNFGNTLESNSLHITIGFSSDSGGQIPAGSIETSLLRSVRIKPGKSIKLHLHGWKTLASSLQPGTYFLTVVISDDTGQSTTAVSTTAVVKT